MRSIPIPTSKLNTTTTTITPSLWHTPIPYLFGGLAAILGLIAFSLLVLACSYCGFSRNHQDGAHNDLDNKEGDTETKEPVKTYEEKILVIMAGDEKPTFLATPIVLPNTDKEIDNHVHVTVQENEGSCSCSS